MHDMCIEVSTIPQKIKMQQGMEPNDDGGCFYIEGGGGLIGKFGKLGELVPRHNFPNTWLTCLLCVGYTFVIRTDVARGWEIEHCERMKSEQNEHKGGNLKEVVIVCVK